MRYRSQKKFRHDHTVLSCEYIHAYIPKNIESKRNHPVTKMIEKKAFIYVAIPKGVRLRPEEILSSKMQI